MHNNNNDDNNNDNIAITIAWLFFERDKLIMLWVRGQVWWDRLESFVLNLPFPCCSFGVGFVVGMDEQLPDPDWNKQKNTSQ